MAQIILNIPDAQVTRIVDALCAGGHWSQALGVSRADFAKAELARLLRERVMMIERKTIRESAEQQAAAVDEPTVT